jgi:GTP-binding protein HflX
MRDEILARAERSGDGGRTRAVAVSAVTGEGSEALLALVATLVDPAEAVEVRAPAGQGGAVAWLYQHGRVTGRADEEDGGVRLNVRLNPQALGQFERLYPDTRLKAAAE